MILNSFKSKQSGFTFVELLVVIAIIGVVFASGVVAFGAITVRSRDARRKSDLESIRQALEMCRSITGVYPDAIYDTEGIKCADTGPITLVKVPKDPRPDTTINCLDEYTYVKEEETKYSLTSCLETSTEPYQVNSP